MGARVCGCPRGGECYAGIDEFVRLRVTRGGEVREVDEIPPDAGLPGSMLARRPGERNYVRMGTSRDLVIARFEEGAPREPIFRATDDGSLVPIDG